MLGDKVGHRLLQHVTLVQAQRVHVTLGVLEGDFVERRLGLGRRRRRRAGSVLGGAVSLGGRDGFLRGPDALGDSLEHLGFGLLVEAVHRRESPDAFAEDVALEELHLLLLAEDGDRDAEHGVLGGVLGRRRGGRGAGVLSRVLSRVTREDLGADLLEEDGDEILGDALPLRERGDGFLEVVALEEAERDDLAVVEGDGELEEGLLGLLGLLDVLGHGLGDGHEAPRDLSLERGE